MANNFFFYKRYLHILSDEKDIENKKFALSHFPVSDGSEEIFENMICIAMIITVIWSFLGDFAVADVYLAMADLEHSLGHEASISLNLLKEHIQAENIRLEKLGKEIEQYEKLLIYSKGTRADEGNSKSVEIGERDGMAFANPINAYLIIKRIVKNWEQIQTLMKSNMANPTIYNINKGRRVKFPDNDDVDGAAHGLLRLQDTYLLNTTELARGYVQTEYAGMEMNARDCFKIGLMAESAIGYHYYAIEWLNEALQRNPGPKLKVRILDKLAEVLYKQGNPKHALIRARQVSELKPNDQKFAEKVKWYERQLTREELNTLDTLPEVRNIREHDSEASDVYKRLCRGELAISPPNDSRLYCYLKRYNNYLQLAPIKVEILRFDPLILLFRKVISREEIDIVKQLASSSLDRATIQNPTTGKLEHAGYRITKTAWLDGRSHPVLYQIAQRIHDMTDLDLLTAEPLQVANYGIGGHYTPHLDFTLDGDKDPYGPKHGNRIATVLFYMSQPKSGGHTVFSELKQAVVPSATDALFWYNLHADGRGDMRTIHAACPVINGVKWVANAWIHERGQEFIRKCPLKKQTIEEK